MDLKQELIDLAREATGDNEITVAGDFQPKGLTWKRAAAAGAGSLVGSAVSEATTRRPGSGHRSATRPAPMPERPVSFLP